MAGRGESRLCSVTYSAIADWTGLTLQTVRTYATTGAFDRHSLESVLSWVNARRASKGLPLIGQPITGLDFSGPEIPAVNRSIEYKPASPDITQEETR